MGRHQGLGHDVFAGMAGHAAFDFIEHAYGRADLPRRAVAALETVVPHEGGLHGVRGLRRAQDRKSTRLNSSHLVISYAVFCLKKKIRISSCTVPLPAACVVAPSSLS